MRNILLVFVTVFTTVLATAQPEQNRIFQSSGDGNLLFIENKNQWPGQVAYSARMNAGSVFLENNKFTFYLIDAEHHDHKHTATPSSEEDILNTHTYEMLFLNASQDVKISASEKSNGSFNYLKGNDPLQWGQNASGFRNVYYSNIYTGIDIQVYQSTKHLKWDYIITAGADPSLLQVQYNGADDIYIRDGKLRIVTSVNTAEEYIPEAYQIIEGKKIILECKYILIDNVVQFQFPDGYNPSYELIIDPVLTFSTYSGSFGDNFGFTATYDTLGHLYGGGIVLDPGYPTTTGAFQTTFSGNIDIGISKFTPDGTALVYATYIGGSDAETPNSLVVNSQNQLVVLGVSSSVNFPVSVNAYDNTFNGGNFISYPSNGTDFFNGTDVVVTILNAQGNNIIGSTYFGGSANDGLNEEMIVNYGDQFRGEVILGDNDDIFVATSTKSSNIPTTPGAVKTTLSGVQDAVVFSLNSDASSLLMSTYIGGLSNDAAFSLKHDSNGDLYIVGSTSSADFPATLNSLNPAYLGNRDGFITKLEKSGVAILNSSFIGTPLNDQTYFVELDDNDDVYLVGQTWGSYPVSTGVYNNPNSGQYITKLTPDLSTIIFSTVFGKGDGDPELSPTAFLVDRCQNIYFSGWGGNTNGVAGFSDTDISGLPLTSDAFQSFTDGSDFYFFVLSKDAASLKYSSYFGGGVSDEHVDGGTSRFDKEGIIYQAVCAGCGSNDDFPTTPGAYSPTNNSSNCNLGVAKFEFQLIDVEAEAIGGPETVGCAPLTVNFVNSGTHNVSYAWDFGDGNTSTLENPTYTFTDPGEYIVTLIVIDSADCISLDTATITVKVNDVATADFTASPEEVLIEEPIQFNNNSNNSNNWFWTFGDGSSSTEENPQHTYSDTGTYNVCLVADNAFGCPDTLCKTVIVGELSVIDLPTAFSPNNDGVNDIFYVRGSGVIEMRLRIFNRWGQLIFETNNLDIGWDGTYKGEPQEMEVYMYTLDAVLRDFTYSGPLEGRPVTKSGNITLIR